MSNDSDVNADAGTSKTEEEKQKNTGVVDGKAEASEKIANSAAAETKESTAESQKFVETSNDTVVKVQSASESAQKTNDEVEAIAKTAAVKQAQQAVKQYHEKEFIPAGKKILADAKQEVDAAKLSVEAARGEAEKCGRSRTWSLIAAIIAVVCLLGSIGLVIASYSAKNETNDAVQKIETAKTAAETALKEAREQTDLAKKESDAVKSEREQFQAVMKAEKAAVKELIEEIQTLRKEKQQSNTQPNNPNPNGQ
jgi:hypothetical protein